MSENRNHATDECYTEQPEYRIEYTVQRFDDAVGDFVEIGFGSSGGWGTVDYAAHMVLSAVQNRQWETEPGMPDPDEAP